MSTIWAALVPGLSAVGMIVAGLFTARATRAAAAATATATEAAAVATAEPAQREQDREAFKEIRDGMRKDIGELRAETSKLRAIVRAFAGYVGELSMQMRQSGIEPPEPPDLVDEYNRTGV